MEQRSSCSAASQTCTYTWNVQDSCGRLHTFTSFALLPESEFFFLNEQFTYSLAYWRSIKNCFFPPTACCLTCPHAHRTRTYHALLNFPAIARLGSLLQYNPTPLLLVFKHKLWLKASQCLQLSCFYCKLQQLIKALTLWYHDLLETGKVGEARVFAMTPRLLRSLKLSQSSQRLLWLTPVNCGSSWVSWEER